jgi:hypothetical protein
MGVKFLEEALPPVLTEGIVHSEEGGGGGGRRREGGREGGPERSL